MKLHPLTPRLFVCALWAMLGVIWMTLHPQGSPEWLILGGVMLPFSAVLTRLKLGWERRKRTSAFPPPSWCLVMNWRDFATVTPQSVLAAVPGTLSLSAGMFAGYAITIGAFCYPALCVAAMGAGHCLGLIWFLKRGNGETEAVQSLPVFAKQSNKQ